MPNSPWSAAKRQAFIESKILRTTGCWYWTGTMDNKGYGKATVIVDGYRRRVGAHRAVYEYLVGPIPAGMTLDHTCHTNDWECVGGDSCPHRRCVNPMHLEPVSGVENVRRGRGITTANSQKNTCPQGHPFDVLHPDGSRGCRTCANARTRAYRRSRGAAESRVGASDCPRGHTYTEANTRWTSRGYRACKMCDRERRIRQPNSPIRHLTENEKLAVAAQLGSATQRVLADRFGISVGTIASISRWARERDQTPEPGDSCLDCGFCLNGCSADECEVSP